MSTLIAIGAGIAVLTGMEPVLVSVSQHPRLLRQLQDSRRLKVRSPSFFCLDPHWQRQPLSMVS